MRRIAILTLLCWGLIALKIELLPDGLSPRYAAEVGFCRETSREPPGRCEDEPYDWDVWGDFHTLNECQSIATSKYNEYWKLGRAYSWACLLKNGKGGYTSRHR
jgi:hypothetical protein